MTTPAVDQFAEFLNSRHLLCFALLNKTYSTNEFIFKTNKTVYDIHSVNS